MLLKRVIVAFVLFISANVLFAQSLKSPEQFLGYKVGTKFTPHWKVVQYFEHVATAVSSMVKIEKYGETNEGRPLMVAFVASAENKNQLEEIRKNNLRLAGILTDKPANENAPAIVWLSYNVHGNEASSTEASMLTIYSLVNPAEASTKEFLKNTVVVIDPCINPDGRDRYVNYYNSVVGVSYNEKWAAREHSEPWPNGRSNHYNFDLNRDWAWQTQIESQHRIKLYNQWLPQVHVDYHEQGFNEPYYFAPAAEPYHDVITPWQRAFQVAIGKNNAKYFDKNGWLYFTKERFDLFYPSYGDTYPTYNGSIGMTYEQGGIGAGLAVITEDDDTLTLVDRAMHHYTTGISTIEISSQNASTLVKEFKKFFSDAIKSGAGEYKSYLIKIPAKDKMRWDALKNLLDKNSIQYSSAVKGNYKGYNYFSNKDESFTTDENDIVISSLQPRSALVRVLFDPVSRLSDSATYDITAWSLPYAYGLQCYASKEKLAEQNYISKIKLLDVTPGAYAYCIRWNGVKSATVLGKLMLQGVRVRYAEQDFESNGQKFDKGTLIITKAANNSIGDKLNEIVKTTATAYGMEVYSLESGFVDKGFDLGSDRVRMIHKPNVVMLTGSGVSSLAAGEIWHFFDRQLEYPIMLVNADDTWRLNWNDVDVLILPDGNYKILNDKASAEELKSWINKGGRLIALENAVSQIARNEWGIKMKKSEDDKDKKEAEYQDLKKYDEREKDYLRGSIPGAIFKVSLDNTHPLAFGYPDFYYTLKMDNNVFEFMKEGWNVGVIKKENEVSGFVGSLLKPKLKDGLLFGVQDMGRGSVVYLTDDILFRSFWENGKLMLCNAVFLVGQ